LKEEMFGTNVIQLKNKSTIKIVLYAGDQELLTKSENELQMAARQMILPRCIISKYPPPKTKLMGMCGNKIRRLKIMIEGKIIENITEFKYLGNKISEYKKDVEYKL
jgi:hypothetical protein